MATSNKNLHEGRGEGFERLVLQEDLILDVTERLIEAIDREGMTRAELAERLGKTPGYVSQILNGERNFTLRTIADVAAVLSYRPALELTKIQNMGTVERTLVEARDVLFGQAAPETAPVPTVRSPAGKTQTQHPLAA